MIKTKVKLQAGWTLTSWALHSAKDKVKSPLPLTLPHSHSHSLWVALSCPTTPLSPPGSTTPLTVSIPCIISLYN